MRREEPAQVSQAVPVCQPVPVWQPVSPERRDDSRPVQRPGAPYSYVERHCCALARWAPLLWQAGWRSAARHVFLR